MGEYDPELTYRLRPGACTFSELEFVTDYRINSLGVRDDEASLDGPEIIVLGDSFAMGWGVEQQESFLEQGEIAMKPLILKDVADLVGVHESTVSRATTRKYMLTPRGLFELKYFFSSHVRTMEGSTISATAVKARIQVLIESEPHTRPLSDQEISRLLQEGGIRAARRTIAKYRESLGIGSSSERRRSYRRTANRNTIS